MDRPAVGDGSKVFQPMPELAPEQYAALRADIEHRGVVVPITVDQHNRVIDGHNRKAIATDLGIDCPTEVRQVADDDEAADLAVTLNCARRHLTREQIRAVIRGEIQRRPDDSDRAIARRAGCDHKTVGVVRRQCGEIPHPVRPITRAEAEELGEAIRQNLLSVVKDTADVIDMFLSNAIMPGEIIRSLYRSLQNIERRAGSEAEADLYRDQVFGPLIDYAADPVIFEYWRPQWDGAECFEPLSPKDKGRLLDELASIGGRR